MKLGIITFHNAHNYGAALQVLASQTYLTKKGYDCEVVNYRIQRIERTYAACSDKRKQRFDSFISKYLRLSPQYNSLAELQSAVLPYDILYAGSDQIWNSSILGGLNSAYFCNFGKEDCRRIIYGASLGNDELSSADRFLLRRYLQYPDFISVREASAIPLLKSLTTKPLTTVLDPTFLLDPADYLPLLVPANSKVPYIYLHYVHHTGENRDLDRIAGELSEKTGLPIVKNRAGKRFENELSSCQDNGPGEFLGVLSEAAYIVTDSFHATVFSILFGKHFLTVPPVKRPERLLDLLNLLLLQEHLYHEGFDLARFLALPSYIEELPKRLVPLKCASESFLEHALTDSIHHDRIDYHTSGNAFYCYGCGCCDRPLSRDKEGFLYPEFKKADVSPVSCFLGEKKRVQNDDRPSSLPVGILGFHNDLLYRMLSFEGGFLPAFFKYICKNNGLVIATAYDAEDKCSHYRTAGEEDDCIPFLSLRPDEANPQELYTILSSLPEQVPVLLMAAPCHLAALVHKYPSYHKRLFTIALECNGVTSPTVLQDYFHLLESVSGHRVTDYNFAAKHYGKNATRVEFQHANGTLTAQANSDCPLFKAYRGGALQRPSCYTCEYRDIHFHNADISLYPVQKERPSDITPEDQSLSCIWIHTDKGQELWKLISTDCTFRTITAEEQNTFLNAKSIPLNNRRPTYFENLLQKS